MNLQNSGVWVQRATEFRVTTVPTDVVWIFQVKVELGQKAAARHWDTRDLFPILQVLNTGRKVHTHKRKEKHPNHWRHFQKTWRKYLVKRLPAWKCYTSLTCKTAFPEKWTPAGVKSEQWSSAWHPASWSLRWVQCWKEEAQGSTLEVTTSSPEDGLQSAILLICCQVEKSRSPLLNTTCRHLHRVKSRF